MGRLWHCSTAAGTAVACRPSQDGGGRAVAPSTARPPPAPLWRAVQVKTAAVEQWHPALLDRRRHRCGVPSKSRRRRSSSGTQHCSTAAGTAVAKENQADFDSGRRSETSSSVSGDLRLDLCRSQVTMPGEIDSNTTTIMTFST